ncbi:MAG: hypothetical protein K1X79_04560 [Oligoflexia bacterium]|nr:hypothetical protein [Oligoflexia bacterium]
MAEEKDLRPEKGQQEREANTCMALGAGVGVLGAASAALTGALCPLCVVVAPGLIGLGAYRKWSARQIQENKDCER